MSHIKIEHNLTEEDKAIIRQWLNRKTFPVSMTIGTEEQLTSVQPVVITCEHCKYRTARTDERFTHKEYYCGYEFGLCDPYEMTRNANDPNYFCADAKRRES